MKYRRRLRSRLILSFLVFGTLLSALFAIAVLFLQNFLEDALITQTLADEVDQYIVDLREDPTLVEPFYTRIQGYVTRPDRADIVPAPFRALPSGVHEVKTEQAHYKAIIRKEDDFWVFLTYDVSDNRELSRRLIMALIAVVVFFSALSLALGIWSSGRVLAPVTALAKRLEALDEHDASVNLQKHFPDDEVGQLAAALDDYAARQHELIERDQAFNADVSHELRTPLAVIAGATELMLSQPDLTDRNRERLLRIARAARQSTDTTTALLYLVRANHGDLGSETAQAVSDIANQVLDNYRPLIGDRALGLKLFVEDEVSVIAPEAVISVVLGNLVGNAVRYTKEGEVCLVVGNGQVIIQDTGPGIDPAELPHVFERHFRGRQTSGTKGSGLGLSIVKRLVDLYGWTIEFANRPEGGLAVKLAFFPDLDRIQ
ncbi:MAG TPA: HAMP domain-containing sensor histidine kinase [Wenzhouxiangella sp.]